MYFSKSRPETVDELTTTTLNDHKIYIESFFTFIKVVNKDPIQFLCRTFLMSPTTYTLTTLLASAFCSGRWQRGEEEQQ